MIPLTYIDNVLVFIGFTFLTGCLNASLTTFDSTVGGAGSAGNLNIQLVSMTIYVPTVFLILYRLEKFLSLIYRNLFLFLFFLFPIFSLFWSIAPDLTGRRVIALTGTTLFISYSAIALSPERTIRILSTVFGTIAFVCLVFAIALPGLGTHEAGPYAGVWRGLFAHKNRLGGMMVLAATTIYLCPKYNRNEKIVSYACIITAVFLVIMSESKTSLVTLIFISCLIPAIYWISDRGGRSAERAIFVFFFGIISASILIKNTGDILEFLGKDPTLTGRTETWELAWDNILERPLFGYGYRVFWSDKSPARLGNVEGWRDKISHSHNTYLDLLLDLGFFGFIFFLIVLAIFTRRISAVLYFRRDPVAVWMLTFAAYMVVVGITERTILEQSDIVWAIFILSTFSLPYETRHKNHIRQRAASFFPVNQSTAVFQINESETQN